MDITGPNSRDSSAPAPQEFQVQTEPPIDLDLCTDDADQGRVAELRDCDYICQKQMIYKNRYPHQNDSTYRYEDRSIVVINRGS